MIILMRKKSFVLIILMGILLITIIGVWLYIQKSKPGEKLIGGDKDDHGCLIGAGYSWCEAKSKCLRVWEEKCPNN